MKFKFSKFLSIILALSLLLSAATVSGGIVASAAAKTADYYVGYGGTGDGTSLANMAPTVAKAIQTMNSKGLRSGDTVNIYIVQNITAFECNTTDDDNYYHNLASWGSTVEHDAKIIIKAYEGNTYNETVTHTFIATSDRVGRDTEVGMGGPTEFQNVAIFYPYGSNINNFGPISANGNEVIFGEECTFRYLPNINSKNETKWDLTVAPLTNYLALGSSFGLPNNTYDTAAKITYKMSTGGTTGQAVYFPYGWANPGDTFNFKNDVTLENAGSNGLKVIFGTLEPTAVAIFEKNVNIKETKGTNLRYQSSKSNIVVKGGLQVITSSNVTYNSNDKFDNAISVVYKDEDFTTPADLWKLKVDAAYIDYIDFVEGKTGEFSIDSDSTATATHSDGTVIKSSGGVLDLSAKPGAYTITFQKQLPKVYEYYVAFGGTGNGTSIDNPAPNVATVIDYINACNITEEETATVYILQDIERPNMVGNENSYNNKFGIHNLASWSETSGTVPSHKAKIVVKAHISNKEHYNDTVNCTYLAIDKLIGYGEYMYLGGPTEFQDIMILYTYGTVASSHVHPNSIINTNGNDLTLGEGVTYGNIPALSNNEATWAQTGNITVQNIHGIGLGKPGVTYTKPFKLSFNLYMSYNGSRINVPAADEGAYTFKEDVTFEFNHSSYLTGFNFGNSKAATTTTFEKNLNFKFNNSGAPNNMVIRLFDAANKVVVKGGVQIIETPIQYSTAGSGYASWDEVQNLVDENGNRADFWYIKIDKLDGDKINFLNGQTGKFEIHPDFTATATNTETNARITSEDGVLDLSRAAGNYTVEFVYTKREEETHNYDDAINYRGYNGLTKFDGALANTCKKLTTKEEVNVVYMGGSLLNESDDASIKSQINTWLNNNFAKSTTINFVDKTLKDNGTTFGALRVARDVVSKLPDLVFIEYSLDDNLQGVSAEKSATQLETIVREIKSAYPNSDIVVLITSNAQGLAQDVICEKYDISTINIGTNKAEYFDVIKEFLVNTLLFGESQDTYRITDQELPQIASKIILNGNTSFIYPVDVDITTAGGTVYDDEAKGLIIPDYVGVITAPAASKDTLSFTFEGTELYILSCEGYDAQNTYKISVDGKEFETKNYSGNILTKAVESISSGKHTVVIEPSVTAKAGICGFYSRDLENCENNLTICDLVSIDESLTDNGFDYNNDDAIDNKDISSLKKILLGDWMRPELNSTKHIQPIARLGWRPYTGNLPEQSLVSYQKAYETGHRILLCDIRITADGYMVCCHDDDISKVHAYKSNGTAVSSGEVKISETTLAELLTYDFGKYKGHDGLKILQPEDFLKFCKDLGDVTPVLEMKDDPNDEQLADLVALIKKYGFEDSIMFVSVDQRIATALPNCTMGDWVYTLTDGVIARMDALTCKGKFVYVARDGGNEDSINFENYVKCKAKGIDLAITYIPSTYKDYFNGLKDKGIFNYCKYIALDEVSWLYE